MKKFLQILILASLSFGAKASVPTEEGLLRNLNNADLQMQFVTVKMMLQSLNEPDKVDYVKLQLSLDNANAIGLLQTVYSKGKC